MNMLEYQLIKVAEEAAEVGQAAAKCLTFTCDEIKPGLELSNIERLEEEILDLIIRYEQVTGLINRSSVVTRRIINRHAYEKLNKMIRYENLSCRLGTLIRE